MGDLDKLIAAVEAGQPAVDFRPLYDIRRHGAAWMDLNWHGVKAYHGSFDAALDAYETAALTLTPGKRYLDGHGEVKGPLHRIHWENGEEMLTDSYVVWHPDGTLAGGTREDKRSLVAEVGDAG